jgi:hypothetical protein
MKGLETLHALNLQRTDSHNGLFRQMAATGRGASAGYVARELSA